MNFYNTNYYYRITLGVIILKIILTIIAWPIFSLVLAWPVKLLWNWLMPIIFSLPAITFWQAAGLMLLISILFRWRLSIGLSEKKSEWNS